MTKDNFEFTDGGFLRDQFGRRELLARSKHQALNPGDALVAGTVIDSDGREQVVFVDGPVGTPGPQGPPGAGTNWRGIWSSIVTYALGDGVSRLGLPYVSNANGNLNHDPSTDAVNWTLTAGASIGVDVWNTQTTPSSVTDWGPIINTLISSSQHLLLFGKHDFPFSTKIDLTGTGKTGFVFEGAGARSWDRPDQNPTRLIWKGGAGSGTAIDMRSSSGVELRGLAVLYDSAAYDGDLIDMGFTAVSPASAHKMEQVALASTAPAVRSARSLLKLNNAVGHTFRDMTLRGATCLVRGAETGTTISNQLKFDNVMFDTWTNGAVANGGIGWHFSSCCFEFPNCPANARAFITDAVWNANFIPELYFTDDCTFWDYNQAGQGVVTTTAAHGTINLTFRDCDIQNGGANAFLCPSPGQLIIENVTGWAGMTAGLGPFIDLTGTAKKVVAIRDCPQFNVSGTSMDELVHGLDIGHNWVDVWGYGSAEIVRGARTVQGFERVIATPNAAGKPAIVRDVLQTGLAVSLKGSEYKGYIVISGNALAGVLATITYPKAMFGVSLNIPHILLGLPVQGFDGGTYNPDIFYTSQIYAQLIGSNDLTGFKVSCISGWTGKSVAIPYEVAVLT